jgi:hypothetical protein
MVAGHEIPELDRKGLRHFGFVTGGIVAVLFGLLLPWLLGHSLPLWPWILFAVLAGLGLVQPDWLRPIYSGWMRFGLLASKVTTPLVLGIVFFLLISPMAFFRKLFGRDAMNRQFESAARSYRVESVRKSAKSLENPF